MTYLPLIINGSDSILGLCCIQRLDALDLLFEAPGNAPEIHGALRVEPELRRVVKLKFLS